MDFHQKDIRLFLLEAIPERFGHLSPQEFGDFVKYLFEVDGFDIVGEHPSEASTQILIARKDDITHAIFPLLAAPGLTLDEALFNQVIRAADLHDAEQSWIITTLDLAPAVKEMAEDFGVDLWDWDALYQALCQLFFQGKSHEDYFEQQLKLALPKEQPPVLKLKAKWQPVEGIGAEWFNLVLTITNPTDENVYVHLQLPALIDHKRHQIMADQWVDDEFVSGLIYAGASVTTNALFAVAKVGDRPPGGRIMLTCHERAETPATYHLQARIQGQACYIVTYCYSTQSPEYSAMVHFRDHVLDQHLAGRLFIRFYYAVSPWLVWLASRYDLADRCLRWLASRLIPFFLTKPKH